MHLPRGDELAVLHRLPGWLTRRLSRRDAAPRSHSGVLPPITPSGHGMARAWDSLCGDVLPSAFATDHPRYLAFVGGAPSTASVLADIAIGASSVYAGSVLEAGGVVAAETAALRWLADLAGLPPAAHGAFVSGGSMANLSALVAARHHRTGDREAPSIIVAGATAHSSVRAAAAIMGCELLAAGSPDHPLTGVALSATLDALDPARVVAVVASAGATNTGAIDHLDRIAEVCRQRTLWLHVDAAYGGAALLDEHHRGLFTGIEAADSITIDPHKWLFTPYECAAVLYREPAAARAAHRQHAPYLDAVNDDVADNPADYAVHLSRRAHGLPLWTSLIANGTEPYGAAVAQCLRTACYAANRIRTTAHLDLSADPSLSVVLFQRRGWSDTDYASWSRHARAAGLGLITPTRHAGRTALRLCIVNPLTTEQDIDLILDSLS
jgi:glutamate/tyrosine decarboxylase-like PLP-dependent enzyme